MTNNPLNPLEYPVNRHDPKPKGGNFKRKGDFNGNFILYIKYHESIEVFNRAAGQQEKIQSYSFYSKREGELEPSIQEIFEGFSKLVKLHSSNMQYAIIYLNLNRGNRINKFWELNSESLKIPYDSKKGIQNLRLCYFSGGDLKTTLGNRIFDLPLIQVENLQKRFLDRYYNNLTDMQDRGISPIHRQIIYAYFQSCYLLMHPGTPPQTVETTDQKFEATPPPIVPKVQFEPLVKPKPLKEKLQEIS
ncbi:MAG: hypothetical protein ACRC2M_22870, partial [Planktothrix sp.]